MAKLVLVFLVVWCLLVQVNIFKKLICFFDTKKYYFYKWQLIIAARITRDTSTETKQAEDDDSVFAPIVKSIKEIFSEPNMEVNNI